MIDIKKMKIIDLFAWCWGFSYWFSKAWFNITTAVEFDKMIAESYKNNHKNTVIYAEDIKNLDNKTFFKNKMADIIIWWPPCQWFSMAWARIRNWFIEDPRNYLFKHYFNIVKLVRPKLFILENVKWILTLKNWNIFSEIKRSFEDPENFDGYPYKIQYQVIKAKEFWIPQNRERVIIVWSQFNFNLDDWIQKTKKIIINTNPHFFNKTSIRDAISDLPSPTDDGIIKTKKSKSIYQDFLKNNNGITYNHVKTHHNDVAIRRMSKIKKNENFTILHENIKSVHSGSYWRLDSEWIAPTITTRFDTPSWWRFIHPFENRTITPREAARIQSFPDDFHFTWTKTSICKQIGNAVPPKLAYFFAILVQNLINND